MIAAMGECAAGGRRDGAGRHSVAVARDFVAQHYLVGGDFGAENRWHSHAYRVEATVLGARLDAHDFLVDITALERHLDTVLAGYRERTLNDLPGFAGRNPSVELFAQRIGLELAQALAGCGAARLRVRLWEHPAAWAGFSLDL